MDWDRQLKFNALILEGLDAVFLVSIKQARWLSIEKSANSALEKAEAKAHFDEMIVAMEHWQKLRKELDDVQRR